MAPQAPAWELTSEYIFLSESEQALLDDPSLTDSEYASDILAFSRSPSQDYMFFRDSRQVLVSMGSIGSKNFMINDQVKLHQDLTDQLQFRFHYFKEKDFDQEYQAQVVELDYWFGEHWALGVFGEGTYRKSEIDFGLAVLFKPRETHEVRVWWAAPDAVRNERNKNSDSFSKAPGVLGLKGQWVSAESQEFFVYSLKSETPTHWDFPDQGYRYKYERQSGSVYWRKKWGNDFLTLRWQGDAKSEEKHWTNNTSSLLTPVSMQRTRHLGLVEWEDTRLFHSLEHSLRWGLFVTHRDYQSESGTATQTAVFPHIWYRTPAGRSGGIRDYLIIGMDTSVFRETGDAVLIKRSPDGDVSMELRLTTSYEFQLKNQASLKLILSMDLDEVGTGSTWEGGAGVFQMPF